MSKELLSQLPIEDIIGERFGRYSKYIIQERALPDVRDGLKPVQRRILYAMFEEGNTYNKPPRKSAKTVGLVIGNYHPHGDSSVYDAMVRLSQDWKMNMKLVDMQGNNGSIDDDPAAAMRYTEARLSAISHKLLENIDENVVPFVLNFDDMTTEPSVLPAQFPNLLINGATGIAAGYATNIPPFNLAEVLDAAIYRLNHEDCDLEEIVSLIQGPDFPTGAIIQGKEGIRDILRTGRGRLVVRAKTEIVEKKSLKQIVITELPYEVIKGNLVRKIDDLRYTKANEGFGDVMDVRDESDRNGMKIVIDCRKEADIQSILNLFYKHTELQIYYHANMVAIVKQRPKVCSILDILDAYLDFRKEVVLARSRYRYEQKEKRLHIIEGLMKAMSVLDEVIRTIRASKNRSDSRDNLVHEFGFTLEQASAIVDLQLYRLSSTDIVALRDEFAQLATDLDYLDSIIQNEAMLKSVIVKEFYDLKAKFAIERRSVIENEISDLEVDHLNLISDDPFMVTVSRMGYLKKVSLRSYGSSQKESIALMDEDVPVFVAEVLAKDTLVFMTSKGRYGMILVHELSEARWKDVGSHLNQYMKCDSDEQIISVFTIRDFKTPQVIVTVSRQGMIKKSLISDLEVKRTQRLYDVMTLGKEDVLAAALVGFGHDDLLMVSRQGMLMRLSLKEVNVIGLKAKGIIGMRLRKDDHVVSAALLNLGSEAVFVSERDQFKRIKVTDLPLMNRATQGMSIVKSVKSNPHYAAKVCVGGLYDTIRLYHEQLDTLLYKDIPLMGMDATFSTVITHKDVTVIDPYLNVKQYEVAETVLGEEKIAEPLKFDI